MKCNVTNVSQMTAFPPSSPPTCIMSLADDSEPIVAPYTPNTAWCISSSGSNDDHVVRSFTITHSFI